MSTTALNNLAEYILSLGLSQRKRKWLAERITEPADSQLDDTAYLESSPNMVNTIMMGKTEIANGQGTRIRVEDLWK